MRHGHRNHSESREPGPKTHLALCSDCMVTSNAPCECQLVNWFRVHGSSPPRAESPKAAVTEIKSHS